jgi:hypothetical protein
MQVKTILNRIQKHRGFVYGTVQLEEQMAGLALTVDIAPHRRNRPRCAGCGQVGPVYDRLAPRRFEFVPLWGLRVFFLYMMRRVECPRCGVTVEQVPWADGKHQLLCTFSAIYRGATLSSSSVPSGPTALTERTPFLRAERTGCRCSREFETVSDLLRNPSNTSAVRSESLPSRALYIEASTP